MTVPNIFAGQSGPIPLAELDANFATVNGPAANPTVATLTAGVTSPAIPFGGGSVASFNGGPIAFGLNAVVIAGGTNPNNVALGVVSRSNGEALLVNGQNVTGESLGMTVIAGTNSSDVCAVWFGASGLTQYAQLVGDGGFVVGPVGTADPGPGGINASATITSATAVAPAAGGSVTCGIHASSTANLGIFFGTGAPTFAAAQGSIYSNTTGAAGARLYVNTNGSTTWVAATSP
jgi:hypothetical protein